MRARVAGPLLVAAAALACAQPGTPPGGEPDQAPPRVIRVEPPSMDTLRDLDDAIRIRFNERISEQLEGVARWSDAVLVSPATSPVEVDRGRRDLEISLVRGWEPGRAYRVVVLPVFQDLFGNGRELPVDLVFSTGGPIPESAMAGFIRDRITGALVTGARVEALRSADSTTYVAVSDTAGFFALRYTPPGQYRIRAFRDQNQDRQADFFEIQDSVALVLAAGDTAVSELALLPRDSTAARLVRAEAIDTLRVRLLFDDFFEVGPVEGEAWLYALPDTLRLGPGELLHAARLDSLLALEADTAAPAADSVPADSLAAEPTTDTVDVAVGGEEPVVEGERVAEEGEPGVAGEEAAEEAGEEQAEEPADEPLPSQELIMIVPRPLIPDSSYLVRVQGVRNIQGVPGGGGVATFTAPAPTAADTVPADSAALPVEPTDTVPAIGPERVPAAPPDTVPPDTVPAVAPDTVPATAPDTVPSGANGGGRGVG